MNDLKAKMQAELVELPFVSSDFSLTQFNGGTVNSSYRLDTADNRYFVKTFESDEINFLDRERLFNIQLELSIKGLSVLPVYLSKINHFQVDQWLDDITLDIAEISELEKTKRLASILAHTHSLDIAAPKLDLPSKWRHYLNITKNSHPEVTPERFNNMATIWQQACDQKTVFCHNDLALSHVTQSQPAIVFDWEYCATSCPYFDLASCIKVNGLNATDQASLCAYYAQFADLHLLDVINKVSTMRPLVDFTYTLWYQTANVLS